ncbi:MAG: GMC family oxidoreductase [Gemmatimonadales bacterium]
MREEPYDAIVIGSGFGGAMTAHVLVEAGWSVLMLERGDWVERGASNWAAENVGPLTEHYSADFRTFHCVGGPSVFYGGVAFRFRPEDFEHTPEIAGRSGARWPWNYGELEPYYSEAEQLLSVAGTAGADPTEGSRSRPYPQPPAALAPVSERIGRAARELGCTPFPLPLAINHTRRPGRMTCVACGTCDGFACAIEAKNDLATVILRPLQRRGLELRAGSVVSRLIASRGRVTGVEAVDTSTFRTTRYRAGAVILAAGALATPHLLLASGLARLNPAANAIGRYLMRHNNQIVFGVFPAPPNPGGGFHKQLAVHDFYFGHPSAGPFGKLGGIQQLATPPASLVRAQLPRPLRAILTPWVDHLTGLLTIAEDQPRDENRVEIDAAASDRFGLPGLRVTHGYSDRDLAAGRALTGRARAILRRAGAWGFYRHRIETYSHAVGTVRAGLDPNTSPLDGDCRFRGLDNLWVVDGSVMPTSAGVNPSLTIAAIALRAARHLVGSPSPHMEAERHVAITG